jgi:hypothetical protein
MNSQLDIHGSYVHKSFKTTTSVSRSIAKLAGKRNKKALEDELPTLFLFLLMHLM